MISIPTIILIFLFNCLQIFGFYAATDYEDDNKDSRMFLWFIKCYSLKWFGNFWSKPICTCPPCMASLHSLIVWIPVYYFMPFSFMLIYIHAVYILALAGINKLIISNFEV